MVIATKRIRRTTPLQRWILTVGAAEIARRLEAQLQYPVTRNAIYHWAAGRRTPRPEHAKALVAVSGNRLTLEDVYKGGSEDES